MSIAKFRRLGLSALAVVVLAVSVAGCSSPASLVDTFTGKITAADFQFSATIAGTMHVEVSGMKLDGTFSGTAKLKGKDSATAMTTSMAGSTSTQESVTVDGTTYTKGTDGTWTKSAKSDNNDISTFLKSAGGLTDKGIETHNGQQLHRLASNAPFDPKMMGLDTAKITDVKVDLVFWAKDDGTPAGMSLSGGWTQDFSGSKGPVTVTLDYNFDSLSGVTIDAPAA